MAATAQKTAKDTSSDLAPPDLAKLPEHALLTPKQLHSLTGFAVVTFRVWAANGRGPKVTRIEGAPRYMVRDVREWLEAHHA